MPPYLKGHHYGALIFYKQMRCEMRISSKCKSRQDGQRKLNKIKKQLLKIDQWDTMKSAYSERVAKVNYGDRPKLFIDGIQML
jgi:hypothetical protein